MQSSHVRVKILDSEYVLKSEEEFQEVYRIADYVNQKMKEVKNNTEGLSEKKIAILAALNIASDYFRLLKEKEELIDMIGRKAEQLIRYIDRYI